MSLRRVAGGAALLLLLVAGLAFMEYGLVEKQECAGRHVYRTRMGLYACEWNSEAEPDLQCRPVLRGPRAYFMVRDLTPAECAALNFS